MLMPGFVAPSRGGTPHIGSESFQVEVVDGILALLDPMQVQAIGDSRIALGLINF
jgi:hypothetical protein